MKAENKIINLLHDTVLEDVKLENNDLLLSFTFGVNKEWYRVNFISNNISDISCIEYFQDKTEQELALDELKITESECSSAVVEDDSVKINLHNDGNTLNDDTVIELKYKSPDNTITGNIDKLQEFWSQV